MEIDGSNNAIKLEKENMTMFINRTQDGFSLETTPFYNTTSFTICDRLDNIEYNVYLAVEAFIKEIIGNYFLHGFDRYSGNASDIQVDVKHKKITIPSDQAYNEALEIVFDNSDMHESKIHLNFYVNDVYRRNNRISFDYDCALHGGYYECFKNLYNRFEQILSYDQEYRKGR